MLTKLCIPQQLFARSSLHSDITCRGCLCFSDLHLLIIKFGGSYQFKIKKLWFPSINNNELLTSTLCIGSIMRNFGFYGIEINYITRKWFMVVSMNIKKFASLASRDFENWVTKLKGLLWMSLWCNLPVTHLFLPSAKIRWLFQWTCLWNEDFDENCYEDIVS